MATEHRLPIMVSGDLAYQSPRSGDAGLDLLAAEDKDLTPWVWTPVRTGLHIAIPDGYVGLVRGRSGMAFRHHVVPFGGVIDPSYRGEIAVLLCYQPPYSDTVYPIRRGQRIAQLVILPYLHPAVEIATSLPPTERGERGFGSSGL